MAIMFHLLGYRRGFGLNFNNGLRQIRKYDRKNGYPNDT